MTNPPAFSLIRHIAARLRGLRGLDSLLRLFHSPDRREHDWIAGWYRAKWNGPEYYLESRYFVEWGCLFYGSQDDRMHAFLLSRTRPDWVGFDIGANFGFYSILLASLASQGRVHSFEPVGWLCERLVRNADHNGVRDRIQLNQIALSNANGTANLCLPGPDDANQGRASLIRDAGSVQTTRVRTQRLDDYVREKGVARIDFIKIDVEGAEDLVIEGALETLARYHPLIIAEINDSSVERVHGLLAPLGYRRTQLPRLHTLPIFREDSSDFLYVPPEKGNAIT